MQVLNDNVHVTPAEWRWVILFALVLVLLAFLPLLIVLFGGIGGDSQFMGILMNYQDGASYFSKMAQGLEGSWLVYFRHTPEPHGGVFIQVVYPALGQLARLLNLPLVPLFHAARFVAAVVMYIALYQLGATIWTRLRSRRMFFLLAALGSGLGWFFNLALPGTTGYPDLYIAEVFPFYSSLVNVHFPLTIACLAILSSLLVIAFRPGSTREPTVAQGGFLAALLSLGIALLYPQALAPLGGALAVYVVIQTIQRRRLSGREVRWVAVVAFPALPIAAYYFAIVAYNPVVAEWNRQNVTAAPGPLIWVLGLGLPLILALPGLWRAVRRFDADGDRLFLLWLAVMIVLIFLPTNVQRRFAGGMMIPIAYFATRSLEDFWFTYVSRRWRYRLILPVIPLMTLSWVLLLVLSSTATVGPFLPRDYTAAFEWLRTEDQDGGTVLASDVVSAWVPGWVGARVVYGHPYETLDAAEKQAAVEAWYGGQVETCGALLLQYNVRYVIVGPEELAMGPATCAEGLTPVFENGSVRIYAP